MKATLKTIAQEVGVSTTIVSLVLNERPCRVSQDVRTQILETAERQHYTPNLAAVSLKSQKTRTLGLLVPDISNPFYSELAKCVEEQSFKLGYNIIFGNSNGLYQRDYEYLKLFITRSTDAAIIIPSASFRAEHAVEFFRLIRNGHIPVLILDHYMRSDQVCNIGIDHEYGSYLATQHLLSLGHRRIGLGTGPLDLGISQQRIAGYRRALDEYGVAYDESLVYLGNFNVESGVQAVSALLPQKITAICAADDMAALGVYQQCSRLGIRIPDDLSVTGFNNTSLAGLITPPLTTVALPIASIAELAVKKAIALSTGEAFEAPAVVSPTLLLRSSTQYYRAKEDHL